MEMEIEMEMSMATVGDEAARRNGTTNMVFWDIEMCPIPDFCKASDIFPVIKRKLSDWGFGGTVKMLAVHVNNYVTISPETSKDLSDSGIIVEHIKKYPGGENMSSYPLVMFRMLDWIEKSPLPANFWFISVDRPFSSCFTEIQAHNYAILMIRPEYMEISKRDDDDDNCSWTWSDILHGGPPQNTLKRSLSGDEPLGSGCSGSTMVCADRPGKNRRML